MVWDLLSSAVLLAGAQLGNGKVVVTITEVCLNTICMLTVTELVTSGFV